MQTSGASSLRDLFEEAIQLAPQARPDFLAQRCPDPELRARVERLIAADSDQTLLSGNAQIAALSIGEAELVQVLPPGTRVGPFELVAVLGEGGSSTVFRARRDVEGVRQDVALKVLRRGLYSPDAQRQFRRERQALSQLKHPGIARLIEGGLTENGFAYIALDLVEGRTITDYARENRLNLKARLQLFLQVCRAVEAAHRALIVHRDLKPSNVLVTDDGQVKLLDFGIAKLLDGGNDDTQTRLPAFTPAYAAPEQRTGGLITTATDVYALGILLGELVTGQRLSGDSGRTPSSQVRQDDEPGVLPASAHITRRSLRGDLDNIVLKAIDPEPERRYVSAGALASDVDRFIEGRPVAAHPPSAWYRAQKFVSRHRGGVGATVLFLLAIFAALGAAIWQANEARQAARLAEREASRANATRDFLVRVFRASDPRIAQDKPRGQITAKELLDLNAPRISKDFATDADTQIELLGIAASIYRELDDQPRYETLHRQQIDLARQRYGDLHPAILTGLLDDADHANDRNDYAQAMTFLEEADPLIRRAGLDRSALRARWLRIRSDVTFPENDPRTAVGEQALKDAALLYAQVAPDDPGRLKTLTGQGFRALSKDPAKAEPFFLQAIAAAANSGDRDDDKLQQFAYPGLAQARETRGDYAGAENALEHAAALARKTYGETHSTTWVPAAEYAWRLHRSGQRERADALFDHLLGVIPKDWTRDSFGEYAREFYAERLAAEGRAQEAIPMLEGALRRYQEKPGVSYELRRNRLYLGDAYDRVGRSAEARAMIKSSLDERLAFDPADHRTVLTGRERWGRFLLTHDDAAGAEEQFRAVLDRAQGRTLEPIALAQGGMARLAIARGDAKAALEASSQAIETFEHVTGIRDIRSAPYLWLIHSEALRLSGDIAGARDWAGRALQASRKYDAPSAPSIAEAQAAVQRTLDPARP